MPNFIKIGGTRTSRQYGEMYTSRTFLFIHAEHVVHSAWILF